MGVIRRNRGTTAMAKFFADVIAGSNGFHGFQRAAVLPIGSVRKAAVYDSRRRIFWIFFRIFSPHGADSPFQMRVTQKSGLIFSSIDRR